MGYQRVCTASYWASFHGQMSHYCRRWSHWSQKGSFQSFISITCVCATPLLRSISLCDDWSRVENGSVRETVKIPEHLSKTNNTNTLIINNEYVYNIVLVLKCVNFLKWKWWHDTTHAEVVCPSGAATSPDFHLHADAWCVLILLHSVKLWKLTHTNIWFHLTL